MSSDPKQPRRWSTLSYAHEDAELRRDNPLYERSGSTAREFARRANGDDPERAARREALMVKRQQPRPVLRPSRALACGPDRAAFDDQWREEWQQARKHNQARARVRFSTRGVNIMEDGYQANPPRDVLRDGNLKASIWRNEGEKGPFYSVSLARTYRDDQGEPRDSQSFAGGDLLRVSELIRKTYDRTQDLRREDRRAQQQEAGRSDEPQPERGGRDAREKAFQATRSGPAQARQRPERSR